MKYFLTFIAGLVIGLTIWYIYPRKEEIPVLDPKLEEYIKEQDRIISYLTLERDSVLNIINNSKDSIQVIEHWYEKEYIDVVDGSLANDISFFSNYLSESFE